MGHLYRSERILCKPDETKLKIAESAHPATSTGSHSIGMTKLQIEGAPALYVSFDPRSCTKSESNAVSFYANAEGTQEIITCGGTASSFNAFVVPGDTVWWKYTQGMEIGDAKQSWGWRAVVGAVPTPSGDQAMLLAPDVELGCWIFDLLLEHVDADPEGAADDVIPVCL